MRWGSSHEVDLDLQRRRQTKAHSAGGEFGARFGAYAGADHSPRSTGPRSTVQARFKGARRWVSGSASTGHLADSGGARSGFCRRTVTVSVAVGVAVQVHPSR